jgi:hypothetical protein
MGGNLGRNGLSRGRKVSLLQVDISQIIVDEADEPNSLVDFLDAEALSGEGGGAIDFLSIDADTAAGGDEDVAVVEGIIRGRAGRDRAAVKGNRPRRGTS